MPARAAAAPRHGSGPSRTIHAVGGIAGLARDNVGPVWWCEQCLRVLDPRAKAKDEIAIESSIKAGLSGPPVMIG
jgi:hypothetical protein